jgi:predicted nucleotidyltransferase
MDKIAINNKLSEILFGKTRQAVLSLLYGHADESFYLRQIVRVAGGGMGAVQRQVNTLVDAGLVTRINKGRQIYYQANAESPVFAELKSIIIKTAGIGDILKIALAPIAQQIDCAFIYGSMARGKEKANSDVDVFVIGQVTFSDVVAVLSPMQDTLGREINPTVYPAKEFREKLSKKNHFIKALMAGEKIYLIGDADELEKLAA